jgi:hypothetical protein
MEWRIFEVELIADPVSQVGLKEVLTPVSINETVPSYTLLTIDIPKTTLNPGLHKLVFHFEVETGYEFIPLFKEGFTYVNITPSPLSAVLMEGSPTKTSRGWGQPVNLIPVDLSLDPDDPTDKVLLVGAELAKRVTRF